MKQIHIQTEWMREQVSAGMWGGGETFTCFPSFAKHLIMACCCCNSVAIGTACLHKFRYLFSSLPPLPSSCVCVYVCVCVCHLLRLDIFVLFRVIESIVWSHFTYFHFHGSLTNKIPKGRMQRMSIPRPSTISNMPCVCI